MGPFGSSARDAWGNVNKKSLQGETLLNTTTKNGGSPVPRGSIVYATAGKYGHAWLANGDMTAWSVDYKRSGYIDLVDIRLKGWSSYYQSTVGYIIGAQYYSDNDGFFKGLSTR